MSPYKYPYGHVFYRSMSREHPLISWGDGAYLFDDAGKKYLDASGGALVATIGHGVDSVARAMAQQAEKAGYIHGSVFTSQAIEDFTEELAKVTPLPNVRFYPLSSGSEAIEGAMKLARQVQVERGEEQRHLIISRWQSYHGASLGALAVTGKEKMRKLYKPMFKDMPHIQPPYCYRCPFGKQYPQCGIQCALVLEDEIKKQGAENVAAFLAEPISGATLGGVVPPKEYWPIIQEICNKYGLLLIADEVMSGMGRTGKWFAVEHFDIEADIMTIGKGAAGGYFPLGIIAARGELVDLIAKGKGDFNHGGTYSHHAIGAAAGLATIKYIQSHKLIEAVKTRGKYLEKALWTRLGELDYVGDIRGMGLMWGVELVKDRKTKAWFDPSLHFAQKLADDAMARGLMIYPGSGTVDFTAGDHFMIGPPFVITEKQIDEMLDVLVELLDV
jgi:adenosylmethionine-8-amino-7-oxononanoate aminotransferase